MRTSSFERLHFERIHFERLHFELSPIDPG